MAAGIWIGGLQNLDSRKMPEDLCGEEDLRDRAWLRQIMAGQEEALDELVSAYGQRLFAYALRLSGDGPLAEDVVQETLLVVWRSAGRFRGQGRVIAWLLGIIHHVALKMLRRQKQTVSDAWVENLPAEVSTPEERFQTSDRQRQLHEGMSRLSPQHREVLELVFFQKLTLAEVAAVIGCPTGTVKSRLNYARKQLRGELLRISNGQESEL